jgi:hypothetical protein
LKRLDIWFRRRRLRRLVVFRVSYGVDLAGAAVPFIAREVKRWRGEYERDLKSVREAVVPLEWVKALSEPGTQVRQRVDEKSRL